MVYADGSKPKAVKTPGDHSHPRLVALSAQQLQDLSKRNDLSPLARPSHETRLREYRDPLLA